MKPKKRQKLCHNCEGEIDLDVIVCPFCAADLREEKPERDRPLYSTNSSLRSSHENLSSFGSLYPSPSAPKAPLGDSPPSESAPIALEPEEESKSPLFPIFLLTLGAQLLILGLMTLIFSHHGAVVLKWSAKFWFVYLFVSLPLLVFGYKLLSKP